MSLEIAREILELIMLNKEDEIVQILDPYSPEQRQCIVAIKHKCSSLLFIAIAKERVSIVTYFLESCGADPNSLGWKNGVKLSCLSLAIDVNSKTIVGILLTHGANTEIISSYGRTPLFHACSNDRESIVRLLIEHGADVNSRNYAGDTPLAESADNLDLFKYLISKGSNINSADDFGQTVLMLGCEIDETDIIIFLLSCENIDVRIRNDYGEDALHLSVRYCSDDIVQEIIKKGSYTKDEIIKVYELESCLSRVGENVEKAGELWQKALKLRSQPSDTPMFENQCPAGRLLPVVDVLNSNDVSAMLYLESALGLGSLFTLSAYICAASNVNNEDKYISLCEFLFDTLHTLDDRLFFKCISLYMVSIRHYLYAAFYSSILKLSKIFRMFVAFVSEIRLRLELLAPQKRMSHANDVECLLYFTIELIFNIHEKFPNEIKMFHKGIKRILRTDLRGLKQKSLTQICGCLLCSDGIIKCFIRCGANVNSTDKEGKTVLHEVVESEIPYREKIVKNIIRHGFDFSRVRCNEYCLQCRMERENIIPHAVKYISLQCLAARTLCEKTITCMNDVPYYLRTIINSHYFITK